MFAHESSRLWPPSLCSHTSTTATLEMKLTSPSQPEEHAPLKPPTPTTSGKCDPAHGVECSRAGETLKQEVATLKEADLARILACLESGCWRQNLAAIRAVSKLIQAELIGGNSPIIKETDRVLNAAIETITTRNLYDALQDSLEMVEVICAGYGKLVTGYMCVQVEQQKPSGDPGSSACEPNEMFECVCTHHTSYGTAEQSGSLNENRMTSGAYLRTRSSDLPHLIHKNWKAHKLMIWEHMAGIVGCQDPIKNLYQCMESWAGQEGLKSIVFKMVVLTLTLSLQYNQPHMKDNQKEESRSHQDWTTYILQPLFGLGNSSPSLRGYVIEFFSYMCEVSPCLWHKKGMEMARLALQEGLFPDLVDFVEKLINLYEDGLDHLEGPLRKTVQSVLGNKNAGSEEGVLALQLIVSRHLVISTEFLSVFHGGFRRFLCHSNEAVRTAGCQACLAVIQECTAYHQGLSLGGETTSILQSLLDHVSTVAVVDTSSQVRFEIAKALVNHKDLLCQLAQDRVSSHLSQGVYDDNPYAQELFIQLICDLALVHEHAGWARPVVRSLIRRVLVDLGETKDGSLDEQIVAESAHIVQVLLKKAPSDLMFNMQMLVESILTSLENCVPISQPYTSTRDPCVSAMGPLFSCLCSSRVLDFALQHYSSRLVPILEVIILEPLCQNNHISAASMFEQVVHREGCNALGLLQLDVLVPSIEQCMIELPEDTPKFDGFLRFLGSLYALEPAILQFLGAQVPFDVCTPEGDKPGNEAQTLILLRALNCHDNIKISQGILDICLTLLGGCKTTTVEVLKLLVEQYQMLKTNICKCHMEDLAPKLVSLLDQTLREGDYQLVGHIFEVLKVCKAHLHSHLPLLLPVMSKFIEEPGPPGGDVPLELKRDYLVTLGTLAEGAQLGAVGGNLFAGQTLLGLIKLLSKEPSLWKPNNIALDSVLESLERSSSAMFAHSIEKAKQDAEWHQAASDGVSEPSASVSSDRPSKCSFASDTTAHRPELEEASSPQYFTFDSHALASAWDSTNCHSDEEWIEWSRRLGQEFLRQSPCDVLRQCHVLARINSGFNRQLFPVSLTSCWSALDDTQRKDLFRSLRRAFSVQVPSEVTERILDLNCLLVFEPVSGSQSGLVSLKGLAANCIKMAKKTVKATI